MGSSFSTPQPPLIALQGASLGAHNKILIPSDAFHPNSSKHARYARSTYPSRPPVYHRAGNVFEDCVFYPTPAPVRERIPRRRGRERGRNLGRKMQGMGMGVPQMGAVPMGAVPMGAVPMGAAPMGMSDGVPMVSVYYDPRGMGAMSVPNLGMGVGHVPLRPAKGKPMMQQPVMMPGQVPGASRFAYPQPQAQAGSPQWQPSIQPQMPSRAPRPHVQKQVRTPGMDDIAYGARIAQGQPPVKPGRRGEESPVSKQLNRTQPSNRKVGPSGHEWLDGENAWLDACTCTTNCHCRKGARVLYRAQDGDDEGQRRQGEIRYIVKDDLGKDCGDHTKCRVKDDNDDDSSDAGHRKNKKKSKRKGKAGASDATSDVGKMREEMAGLRNDLANMKLGVASGGVGLGPGMGPPPMAQFTGRIGQPGTVPQAGFPGMVNGMDPRMDPNMAHMGDGEPFGMLPSPPMQPHLNGKAMGRHGPMPRMGMPGPMGGSGMGFGGDMDFPESEDGMMNPMSSMPHLPPHMAKIRGGRQKPGRGRGDKLGGPNRRRQFDFNPRTEYPPPMRGGNMKAPPMRREQRRNRPPPNYSLDGGDDSGPDGGGRQRFGGMNDDEDDWILDGEHPSIDGRPEMVPPPRRSPLHGRGGGSRDDHPMAEENGRPNQARVDEDLKDY